MTEAVFSMQQPRLKSTTAARHALLAKTCDALSCRSARRHLVDRARPSTRIRRDDALLEHKTAVEAALAGLDDAIGLLRQIVKSKALDRSHWKRSPLRCIDLLLHLGLDGRNLIRLADDLHSKRRLVDKGIQRQHRQDRARRARGRNVVN